MLKSGLKQLDITIDKIQLSDLLQFIELLQKWNKTYNLTAIDKTEEIISKHILDSIAVLPYIKGSRIIDVGSGAGLPGIPLAIVCPQKEFFLIDANVKKTRFIQQCIIEIGLKNVQVFQDRVEQYAPKNEFDTVVSRAYAIGSKLFETTKHLTTHGHFIVMLGKQTTLQDLPDDMYISDVHPIKIPHLQASRNIAVVKFNNG